MKRVQGSGHDATLTGEAVRMMIGIDIASGTADVAADRALSAVRRRLDKTLSVEYTVNELIAEATDPGNLAQMYYGRHVCCFRVLSPDVLARLERVVLKTHIFPACVNNTLSYLFILLVLSDLFHLIVFMP